MNVCDSATAMISIHDTRVAEQRQTINFLVIHEMMMMIHSISWFDPFGSNPKNGDVWPLASARGSRLELAILTIVNRHVYSTQSTQSLLYGLYSLFFDVRCL